MSTTDPAASRADAPLRSAHSFAAVFDPRLNALNLVRLVLATGVIVWHSFPLGGHQVTVWPVHQLMSDVFVDGFFAISGFLIVASWMRDPHWGRFLSGRVLRIFPAFWVCLIVTALVIAPLAQGVWGPENFTYLLKNGALRMVQYDIAGTPLGVPYPGAWDGSLWTLWWEFLCYLGVLALGVVGLLKRAWVIPTIFGLALVGSIVTTLGLVDGGIGGTVPTLSRFVLMFVAGAMIYQYRERIQVSRLWMGIAVAAIAGAAFLPNYRIIAALPIAYVLLSVGALIKRKRLRLRNREHLVPKSDRQFPRRLGRQAGQPRVPRILSTSHNRIARVPTHDYDRFS